MALILHAHPLSSYCWKVLIALYERELEFELRLLDFGDSDAVQNFRSLWPIAKMPVLEDGEGVIVESSIIIEYLDLHHPGPARLIPADPEAALDVRRLDRLFDNYVMAPVQKIVGDRIRAAESRDPQGVADAFDALRTACAWFDSVVGDQWAAGDTFTLADCAAAPAVYYADRVRRLAEFPALSAYLDRLKARPSVARAIAESVPWQHLFPTGD